MCDDNPTAVPEQTVREVEYALRIEELEKQVRNLENAFDRAQRERALYHAGLVALQHAAAGITGTGLYNG